MRWFRFMAKIKYSQGIISVDMSFSLLEVSRRGSEELSGVFIFLHFIPFEMIHISKISRPMHMEPDTFPRVHVLDKNQSLNGRKQLESACCQVASGYEEEPEYPSL